MTDKTNQAEGLENPFAMFATNADVETVGIRLDYGSFWFQVARAGGANKKFGRILAAKMKPYRRLVQEDRLPEEVAQRLMHEAVAEAVVLGWGSTKYGEGKMVGAKGEAIEFSVAALVDLFVKLPDLFQDIYAQSQKVSLFRAIEDEADTGN